LLVSDRARRVRPWKASSKQMIPLRRVWLRAIFTAFSTPSAPVLTKRVFFAWVPGVMLFRTSASRMYGSFGLTWKQEWVNFSACCWIAFTTSRGACPVLRTPMPAAKSM
jgi:hypothetical protein